MIRRNRARSSSLFLMELILAILFFSVSSAVCVQFFVKSHLLSRDANALNHAVNECTGTAELMADAEDLENGITMLKTLYPDGDYPAIQPDTKDADIVIYYDTAFEKCSSQDAAYVLSLHLKLTQQMLCSDMQFTSADSGAMIYELSTKHHIARRTGYEER